MRDPRCSRQQLSLVADTAKYRVTVRQLGANSSGVRGEVLGRGGEVQVGHGDRLELLVGEGGHTVLFNPPPRKEEIQEKTKSPSKEEKFASFFKTGKGDKGKASINGEGKRKGTMANTESEVKKLKKDDDGGGGRPSRWLVGGAGRVSDSGGWAEWREVADGALLVATEHGLPGGERVAAFDIDGTIITTQSGRVFPKDIHDWRILHPEVPGRLKQLVKEGFKIVFITNQAGIARGKMTVPDFRMKVTRIREKLGVSLQVFCSTSSSGFYRKPRPGIWEWLELYGNQGVAVDRSRSFYCGDAAGREAGWQPGKKKDFSCSDRLLAANLGLDFRTPEQEFLKQPATSKFVLPGYSPGPSTLPLLQPPGSQLLRPGQQLIMMVGIMGSGKSAVARLLEREGCVVASNDRTGGRDKTLRLAKEGLEAGRNVVVDNTHVDLEARRPFLEVARRHGVSARCFLMATSHDQARHNNVFRDLTDSSHTSIKEPLLNQFRSKFVAPSLEEGLEEVVMVNCVPQFEDKEEERLYFMHLLEK